MGNILFLLAKWSSENFWRELDTQRSQSRPDHHHHQHKQNNHPAGGTKGREKRGRWGSVGAELEECQGKGGVVESVSLPHPLPGCCQSPPGPPRLILEGICPLFFFQMQRRTFFTERLPAGWECARSAQTHALPDTHSLVFLSLCVPPEELYCPHAQQLHILQTTESWIWIPWKISSHNKLT